jgi:hypothetical protein
MMFEIYVNQFVCKKGESIGECSANGTHHMSRLSDSWRILRRSGRCGIVALFRSTLSTPHAYLHLNFSQAFHRHSEWIIVKGRNNLGFFGVNMAEGSVKEEEFLDRKSYF